MIGLLVAMGCAPKRAPEAAAAEVPVAVGSLGSPLEVVQRTHPQFPSHTGERAALCAVRVEIDTWGRPADIAAFGCPELFARAAVGAVRGWRWKRPRVDDVRARGRTVFMMTMAERGGEIPPRPEQCDYRLTVASDGALTLGPLDPAVACVAAFPDRIAPAPVPMSCSIDSGSMLVLDRCPSEARPWLMELLSHAAFSSSTSKTLWIEATAD